MCLLWAHSLGVRSGLLPSVVWIVFSTEHSAHTCTFWKVCFLNCCMGVRIQVGGQQWGCWEMCEEGGAAERGWAGLTTTTIPTAGRGGVGSECVKVGLGKGKER